MEGRYVFKHAVTRFPEVIQEALEANGYTPADLDLLIPHQANLRISQLVAMGLELPRGEGLQQHPALRQHDRRLDPDRAPRGACARGGSRPARSCAWRRSARGSRGARR